MLIPFFMEMYYIVVTRNFLNRFLWKFPRQNILLLKAYFLVVKVKEINTTKPLDLLHMDLMGLIRTESRDGKRYVLVVVNDFLRYSFVCFLRVNLETMEHLKTLCTRIQVEICHPIMRIMSDRGREFDNVNVNIFCDSKVLNMNI